jgi:hypothetical protein
MDFDHKPKFVHHVQVSSTASFAISCDEEFSIAGGVSSAAGLLLPIYTSSGVHCVAGGVAGIPYSPELSFFRGFLDFGFSNSVTALYIVTYSRFPPLIGFKAYFL